MNRRRTRRAVALVAAVVAVALAATACSSGTDSSQGTSTRRSECIPVDVAVSSEKIQLLGELATSFNASGAAADGTCIDVQVQKKSSGAATTALAQGWNPTTDGPQPTIWSPASTSWGQILNARLAAEGQPPMVSDDPTSFMLTPLVIAMPTASPEPVRRLPRKGRRRGSRIRTAGRPTRKPGDVPSASPYSPEKTNGK